MEKTDRMRIPSLHQRFDALKLQTTNETRLLGPEQLRQLVMSFSLNPGSVPILTAPMAPRSEHRGKEGCMRQTARSFVIGDDVSLQITATELTT